MTTQQLTVGEQVGSWDFTVTYPEAVSYMGPEPSWHNNKEIANSIGQANAVVSGQHTLGVVTERLIDFYGMRWMEGGKLFLKYTKQIECEDDITLKATVRAISKKKGRTLVELDLAAFGRGDEEDRRAIGEASGYID